ncbi:MAG: helix-turn-helix transcriptional regulator [Bacteroidales bacterium]|nr:helix-turn-helix transcriptional regulator [Bacteroidales bacterium]
MSPTQFADAIGIQRPTMSHILARRNNPSLDFVTKVLVRFPEISSEWLLIGKGQMLKQPIPSSLPEPQNLQTEAKIREFDWNEGAEWQTPPKPVEPQKTQEFQPMQPIAGQEKIPLETKRDLNLHSDIERIIVFFSDGTFKSYLP